MHIHLKGRSPCSILPVEHLFYEICSRIDGICITDHWILEPINYLEVYEEPKVFFGVEIATDYGDILAYGIKTVPSKNLSAKEVINFIHNQGGVAICAHPFSNRHFAFGDDVYDFNFDAIEINGAIGKKYNKTAKETAAIMDIPTIGGSDSHSITQLNTMGTLFSTPINSLDDIISAIKEKSCKAIRISY